METVTVKGKVYQIGEWYLNDEDEACTLIQHDIDGFQVDISGMFFQSVGLTVIESVGTITGTITGAPIELEDGEWYMCDMGDCEYPYKRLGLQWFLDEGCKKSYKGSTVPLPIDKMVMERT